MNANQLKKEIHETKQYLNAITKLMQKEFITDERYDRLEKEFKEERKILKDLQTKLKEIEKEG